VKASEGLFFYAQQRSNRKTETLEPNVPYGKESGTEDNLRMKTIIPIAPLGGMRTSGIIESRPEGIDLDLQQPPTIPEGVEEKKDESAVISSVTQPHPVMQLPAGNPTLECDYDGNPSELYLSIQTKRWADAVSRTVSHPDEALTWVSRKERDGKLRWRLLPLHAAIIFKAPEKTVESLLCAFPPGAQCKDDQGMLPIHLAFRNGSSEGVVNLLLVAFPQSIDVKDRKGRIPLTLAQASTSPNREAYIRAIERGPRYYAVAAAATDRGVLTSAQKTMYENQIVNMEKEFEERIAQVMKDADDMKADYEEQLEQIQADFEKTQETSQVLVDHVNSLEAQLSTRSDTERFLATKIANLDASLRDITAAKLQQEKQFAAENDQLREENESMRATLETIEKDHTEIKSRALIFEEVNQKEKQMTEAERKKYEDTTRILEMDIEELKASNAMLEVQLKKRMQTEHTLASQVSDLAGKLAESAAQNSEASSTYMMSNERLQREKKELALTVEDLTNKLVTVSKALDFMASEQERIVSAAKRHEETMAVAAEAQRQIVANTARQEVIIAEASREREQIVAILQRQAEEVERTMKERRLILESVQSQNGEIDRANKERTDIIASVARQNKSMKELKRTQLAGLPGIVVEEHDDDEDIVERGNVFATENGDVDDDDDDDDDDDEYEEDDGLGEMRDFPFPKISLTLTTSSSMNSDDGELEDEVSESELADVDEKVQLALEAHCRGEELGDELRNQGEDKGEETAEDIVSEDVDVEQASEEVDGEEVVEQVSEEVGSLEVVEQVSEEVGSLEVVEQVSEEVGSLEVVEQVSEEVERAKLVESEKVAEQISEEFEPSEEVELVETTSKDSSTAVNNTTVYIGTTDGATNSMEVVGTVSHGA